MATVPAGRGCPASHHTIMQFYYALYAAELRILPTRVMGALKTRDMTTRDQVTTTDIARKGHRENANGAAILSNIMVTVTC